MERIERSWKEPSEVGKFLLKLESFAEVGKFRCSWKVLLKLEIFAAVGNFWLQLGNLNELGKLSLKLETVSLRAFRKLGTTFWKSMDYGGTLAPD